MPSGRGYWIAPDGTVHEIHEHLMFVEERPELFGLTPEEAGRITPRRRTEILTEVIRRGWIRVRHHHGFHIDLWDLDAGTVDRLARFFEIVGAWPHDHLNVGVVSASRRIYQDREPFMKRFGKEMKDTHDLWRLDEEPAKPGPAK